MRKPRSVTFIELLLAVSVSLVTLAHPVSARASGKYDRLLADGAGRAKLEDLAAMEDSRSISGIGRYVSDTDPLIRLRSAEVLGRVGGAGAVPYLDGLAGDSDDEVALTAVYSLGLTLDESALAPLSRVLNEGDRKRKEAALEALGITRLRKAVPIIEPALRNFHSSTRARALEALAVLGDSSAGELCANSIHDPAAEVVEQTAYAVGRLGYRKINGELAGLLAHENLWVVMRACEALGRLGAGEAVESVAKLLNHEERMMRVKAAEALGRIGTDEAAMELEKVLDSGDPYLKDLALRGIAASGRSRSFDIVLPLLRDRSQMVRRSAMEAAASTDPGKARPFLMEIVREGNPYDRAAALEYLGQIGSEEDIKLLVETLDSSANHLEREGAEAGLKRVENDDFIRMQVGKEGRTAFDALLDAADGEDPVIAAMAAEALHGDRAVGGTGRLVEAFRHHGLREDCDRKLAIIAVFDGLAGRGDLGDEAASEIASLMAEAAVGEGDPRVSAAAAAAAARYGTEVPAGEIGSARWNRGRYPWGAPALPLGRKAVRLKTRKGPVEIELFGDDAPNIVKSILVLAEEGFYDGLNFHRVVPGFVVQGGCPRGDGWGDAGWFLRSQFNRHRYERGFVGMAHSGRDTAGSQFFITQLPQPHLDGRYTIIGKVTSGMEIVDMIEVGDTFGMEVVEQAGDGRP